MNDLSDNSLKEIRTIVREEVVAEIAPIRKDVSTLKADVSDLKTDVATLKTDVAGLKIDGSSMKEDIKTIKLVLGNHSMMLGELRSDVRYLKDGFRSQTREMHKLSVLFEDLDDRFQAASELG